MANSSKTGIVIIDPWNFHWCMTACERVSAMVPRWNRALECARKLGMLVIWAPSDVVASYSGYPQRERALATPRIPVPKAGNLSCKFTARQGPCMCGPGIGCIVNFGWDAMNPGLSLANEDYIAGFTMIESLTYQCWTGRQSRSLRDAGHCGCFGNGAGLDDVR